MNSELNKVSLIIATYNEEDSLGFVLKEISDYEFFEVIIVDNNSNDKTIEIAEKFNTKVIVQEQSGWGSAVIQAFNEAEGEYITYMDGDGSYNPTGILDMLKLINDYDFVCCSRYKYNNTSDDDTFIRAIGNKIFTFITRKLLQLDLTDSLFFYPLIRKKDYIKIQPKSTNFGICIEIPFLLSQQDLKYTDILSLERERFAGKTKVNAFIDGIKILFELIKMYLKK